MQLCLGFRFHVGLCRSIGLSLGILGGLCLFAGTSGNKKHSDQKKDRNIPFHGNLLNQVGFPRLPDNDPRGSVRHRHDLLPSLSLTDRAEDW